MHGHQRVVRMHKADPIRRGWFHAQVPNQVFEGFIREIVQERWAGLLGRLHVRKVALHPAAVNDGDKVERRNTQGPTAAGIKVRKIIEINASCTRVEESSSVIESKLEVRRTSSFGWTGD